MLLLNISVCINRFDGIKSTLENLDCFGHFYQIKALPISSPLAHLNIFLTLMLKKQLKA